MRNHGDSARFDTQSYHDMAEDLAELLDEPAFVVGHSMGGKAAMTLALSRPEQVARLLVADIAPVTYGRSPIALLSKDYFRTRILPSYGARAIGCTRRSRVSLRLPFGRSASKSLKMLGKPKDSRRLLGRERRGGGSASDRPYVASYR